MNEDARATGYICRARLIHGLATTCVRVDRLFLCRVFSVFVVKLFGHWLREIVCVCLSVSLALSVALSLSLSLLSRLELVAL